MNIEKKPLTLHEDRKIREMKGIIVHWPAGRGLPTLDNVHTFLETQTKNGYHFLVSGRRVVECIPYPYRALHSGYKSYTDKARQVFGDRAVSNVDSPNNYSIGVCMVQDFENGCYSAKTFASGAELIGDLCREFDLDPFTRVLRHTDVVGGAYKQCPLEFVKDESLYETFLHCVNGFKNRR